MSEIPHTDPDRIDQVRPLSELLREPNLVYHGIGVDLVALDGIAHNGILSAKRREELGVRNLNTADTLTKTASDHISVARTPQPDEPNEAFMSYIDPSSISFAIDPSNGRLEQPIDRGFYDEAFIQEAERKDIRGIVIGEQQREALVVEQPVVAQNVAPDVVAIKARLTFDFLVSKLAPELAERREELEVLLDTITDITAERLEATMGMITDDQKQRILAVDEWLRGAIAFGLKTAYGNADMTVEELVRLNFPDKPLYTNDHASVSHSSEKDFFTTLGLDENIGYGQWDGTPGDPLGRGKLRERFRRRSAQNQQPPSS